MSGPGINIGNVNHSHYKTMVMDPEMKDIFKDGMVVAYKRHRNIRDFICRAKLYEIGLASNGRPSRAARKGWRKCPKCITCAHSENKVKLTCKAIGQSLQISQDITCKDCRVVYVIVCRQTGLVSIWPLFKFALVLTFLELPVDASDFLST